MNRHNADRRIKRAAELGIIVDPEDEWLLAAYSWRMSTKGYVETTIYDGEWRKTVKLHHYIVGTPIWDGEMVDHADRNKLNNRRANLSIVDKFQSSRNRTYVDDAKHYTITYNNKYEVMHSRDGVRTYVGSFDTEEEAKAAYEIQSQVQTH